MERITKSEYLTPDETSGMVTFAIGTLSVDVCVYGRFGEAPSARVNWAGCGSVDVDDARDYALLISTAADWADAFNASKAS
jgi:hypothetical protein